MVLPQDLAPTGQTLARPWWKLGYLRRVRNKPVEEEHANIDSTFAALEVFGDLL